MNSTMTKQQKLRRTGFAADFNAENEDFILADLNLMRDEEEPPPVPLAHFMDDDAIIDSLLINPRFNAGQEPEVEADEPLIDDIDLAEDDAGFNRFIVEALEPEEQQRQTGAKIIPMSDSHAPAGFDDIALEDDAIDSLLLDAGFDADEASDDGKPDARPTAEPAVEPERHRQTDAEIIPLSAASVIAAAEQSIGETAAEIQPEFAADKQNDAAIIEAYEQAAIKKLINDCERKVKKATVISYASLAFGIIALVVMLVMLVMVFSAQTKITKLSDLVTILEEDMGSIAGKNADLDIGNNDAAVERLNYKLSALPVAAAQASLEAPKKKLMAAVAKPVAVNKPKDKPQTQTAQENKKPPAAKQAKLTRQAAWSVDVAAYKDLNSAKAQAAKFAQQGVAVKVAADAKHGYRLKVVGFKNKAAAITYSAKIKKSLNLHSIAVGND